MSSENAQHSAKKKKVIKGIIIAAVVAGAAYWGYGMYQSSTKRGAMQMGAPAVSVIEVTRQNVHPEVSFVAKIEAMDKVGLRARVTGFLQERLFNEGDMVKEGQPLFVIEKVNFEASVREAEANYEQAQAQATNAKAQYDRTQKLFKTKDVSEARLDETKAAHMSAMAAVSQMKARLDLAKQDLDYTEITAPMSGKIGESTFSVGELIGPDSGVLAEIVKIDPIDAVFSVSENEMLSLQYQFRDQSNGNATVKFYTSDGREYPYEGRFSFIDNALDEAMNTLKLKASFPNPDGKLISGQYGRVVLTSPTTISDIVIPMKAVQRDMLGAFVYVVGNENIIEKRAIKTGTELPNFEVVVREGLNPGEKIVVEGFQKISPNIAVTPQLTQTAPSTQEGIKDNKPTVEKVN